MLSTRRDPYFVPPWPARYYNAGESEQGFLEMAAAAQKQAQHREPVIMKYPVWEYYRDAAEFSPGYLPLQAAPPRKGTMWFGFVYMRGTSSLRVRANQNMFAKAILRHISGVNL